MPFTGAHPAAVLAFPRSAIPLSALVIGSMVPDLPLYAPMPYSAHASHHLVGVVTVDLLAGAAAFVVWLAVLRPFVVAYAPPALGRRIPAASRNRPWAVVAGLLLGALTHVVWDAFTHAGAWGARLVPALERPVGPLPAYEWAQYASGVLGVTAICLWSVRRWRAADVPDPDRAGAARLTPSRGLAGTMIAASVLAGTAFGFWHGLHQFDPIRSAFFHAATYGVDAGVLAALGLGLNHRYTARSRAGRVDQRTVGDPP